MDFFFPRIRTTLFSASFTRASWSHKQSKRISIHIHYLSYHHSKIDATKQIRLLTLLRGKQNQPIKCTFTTSYLRPSPPDYVAISYAWEDPSLKHKIECDGKELGVTENVKIMLEHLREEDKDKVYWIDALCINQANLEERNKQVRLMGQIYEIASQVTIWLGPEGHDSGVLEEFIPRLADALSECRKLNVHDEESILLKAQTSRDATEWVALKKLFERPWFNRTWVIQELVVSTRHEILCGKGTFSVSELSSIMNSIRGFYLGGSELFRSLNLNWATISTFIRLTNIWNWRKSGDKVALPYLSYSFWSSQATDPRDKVFAMLALDSQLHFRLEPNYEDTIQNVYTLATKLTLEGQQTGILSLAGIGNHRSLEGLPSWVPDFTTKEFPVSPFGLYAYGGWGSSPQPPLEKRRFHCEGNKLTLHGVKIDAAKSLSTPLTMRAGGNMNLAELLHEADILFSASRHALQDPHSDAQWRSLIADRVFENAQYITAPTAYRTYFQAVRHLLGVSEGNEYPGIEEYEKPETDAYVYRFTVALTLSAAGRRFCVTEKGDVGLVPKYTNVGDLVCVFAGLDVPFIVRPSESQAGTYELVGECYIHGIMRSRGRDLGDVEKITLV